MNDNNIFGDVIYSYTRAQAIDDGVLADLSEIAPDVCAQHFKYPVACTSAVWDMIEKACSNEKYCNDIKGVIHDMLYMARKMGRAVDETTSYFPVIITGLGRVTKYEFKIVCGPGDDAEPVLTIMLPGED